MLTYMQTHSQSLPGPADDIATQCMRKKKQKKQKRPHETKRQTPPPLPCHAMQSSLNSRSRRQGTLADLEPHQLCRAPRIDGRIVSLRLLPLLARVVGLNNPAQVALH